MFNQHGQGYLHNDLKPENILACSLNNKCNDPKFDTVFKLADFGVSCPDVYSGDKRCYDW